MRVSKYISSFLRAQDVKGEMLVTIADVQEETVGRDENAETKPVCYFEELEQGVVLNKTTLAQLVEIFGGDETDDWLGNTVTLFHDPDVYYSGKRVGGLRFRAVEKPADKEDVPF